jgi:ethanolamine ammonia-lyase small subunit
MSSGDDEKSLIEEIAKRVLAQFAEQGASLEAVNETQVREALEIYLRNPRNPKALERIVEATPSRLGVGRTGTRYLTPVYLRLRADHAIAKDAVYSEIADEFVQRMQCVSLRTRAKDRERYLLHPEDGRALHPESRALLEREGTRGADVQLILGDGLSAWALDLNAAELVPAIERELAARGIRTGKRLFVRFARIAVADEIGVVLGAKATIILVGERPGLGTGDSLSAYIAYAPKLGQDNAEKNCVSNIRPLGLPPLEAAKEIATIVARAFQLGKGGVAAAAAVRTFDERPKRWAGRSR